ncbi:polysaccharide deacetylase family protein [Fibrobacterota bacterium]
MNSYSSRLVSDGFAVFLFHGVVEEYRHPVRNYNRKHLELSYFEAVVKDLASHGHPISLDQYLKARESREALPEKSFVITFDDGFENNLTLAAPVLEKEGVPACFYITTGFIESNGMSWIDKIETCLEAAEPGELRLPWKAAGIRFASHQERIALLEEIRDHAKKDSRMDFDQLVSLIASQCGLKKPVGSQLPLDKKMDWEQVNTLASHSLFTIGGHSHNHGILSFLDTDELRRELDTSIALIKKKTGIPIHHYSYPEGLEHCYSETVIQELKTRGICCCPTAVDGMNDLESDPFHLKRIMVV